MYSKNNWIEILACKLPGEKAHELMAPTYRGDLLSGYDPKEAAVMVLFYPSGRQLRLVFIKRNEYDGPHSAQVSFPGGARERNDRSLEETALRETREELGISARIEILGALTPLHIPVSNYMVYPFLAWMDVRPVFRPDPTEVQYVIEATLPELMDPANRESERFYRHERTIDAPFYRVGKDKIWGATAMMLSEVLTLASSLQ